MKNILEGFAPRNNNLVDLYKAKKVIRLPSALLFRER